MNSDKLALENLFFRPICCRVGGNSELKVERRLASVQSFFGREDI
jgi:hypothetical protein